MSLKKHLKKIILILNKMGKLLTSRSAKYLRKRAEKLGLDSSGSRVLLVNRIRKHYRKYKSGSGSASSGGQGVPKWVSAYEHPLNVEAGEAYDCKSYDGKDSCSVDPNCHWLKKAKKCGGRSYLRQGYIRPSYSTSPRYLQNLGSSAGSPSTSPAYWQQVAARSGLAYSPNAKATPFSVGSVSPMARPVVEKVVASPRIIASPGGAATPFTVGAFTPMER